MCYVAGTPVTEVMFVIIDQCAELAVQINEILLDTEENVPRLTLYSRQIVW